MLELVIELLSRLYKEVTLIFLKIIYKEIEKFRNMRIAKNDLVNDPS